MQFKNIRNKSKILISFIGTIVFLAIFALNYFFPLYADDMLYSVFKHGESFDFTKAYTETFQFLDLYFHTWGGRLFAHLLAFILLMFGNIPLSIINSIGYLLLIYFSCKLVMQEKQINILVYVFFAISYFYFTPSFLSSAVWTTGSANYMWMITFTVMLLYYVKVFFITKTSQISIFKLILLAVLSMFVGCTNENLAPVIILLLIGTVLLLKILHKDFNNLIYLTIIFLGIGCSILIFAPGNALRAEAEGYSSLFSSIDVMSERLDTIYASYRYFMFRPLLIYIVALLVFLVFPRQGTSILNTVIFSILLLLVANISIWITIFSPSFPPRAFMSITVLTFIAIGMLYVQIDFSKAIPMVVNCLFLLALFFYAGKDYVTFLKGSYFLDKMMKERVEVIDKVKSEGKNEVYFEKIFLDYRFEYSDFSNYYKDYYNINAHFVDADDPNLQLNK